MSILFAILLFSLLVLVHELGHFIAAKLAGVQVNEFAMFMGPLLWSKQVGETVYSVRLIPMGGYCAMEGEDEGSDNPRSFDKAAWWKRLIILVSGAAMNFVMGLVLMVLFCLPVQQVTVPVITGFEEYATVNNEYGLQTGDRILEVDGEKLYVYTDLAMILSLNQGEIHDLVVERGGEKVTLPSFRMEKHPITDANGNATESYGIFFGYETLNFGGKLLRAWNQSLDAVRMVRLSLKMLVTGQAGFKEMSGPVGIVQQMSKAADSAPNRMLAMMNLMYFGGFIAINLAVMNLLPIPALDGGRVVGLLVTSIVEAATGRKIDPKYEGYLHGAGMMLLLGLMAVIMFKDIFVIIRG